MARGRSAVIPMVDLRAQHDGLRDALSAAFQRVLSSGSYILGSEVVSLERAIQARFGYSHAIGVSNGSDALLLALQALGVGPGAEVITTAFSFFATAGAIARVGATAVFVDIDPRTLLIDPAAVAAAFTARTRAVIGVHLYGHPLPLARLTALCEQAGVPLIEDCAQAWGASYNGTPVGRLGAVGCFSFFPTKNLGACGDGGLIVCGDSALAERIRCLRVHGATATGEHFEVGGNYRLDELQAALLAVKLPHLPTYVRARRERARLYTELLSAAGAAAHGLVLPQEHTPGHAYNQYTVQLQERDALQQHLRSVGVASKVYYPRPLHHQPCFAASLSGPGGCVQAERAAQRVLSLPLYPEQPLEYVHEVVRYISEWLGRRRRRGDGMSVT